MDRLLPSAPTILHSRKNVESAGFVLVSGRLQQFGDPQLMHAVFDRCVAVDPLCSLDPPSKRLVPIPLIRMWSQAKLGRDLK